MGGQDQRCDWAKYSDDQEGLSFINSAGEWTKTKALFPLDYALSLGKRYIVLVEGPRDALRLLSAGVPAAAILGTGLWSDEKRDRLLSTGVSTIFVMMDADPPGRSAQRRILASMKNLVHAVGISLTAFKDKNFPDREKMDPMDLPDSHLSFLKKRIESKVEERL